MINKLSKEKYFKYDSKELLGVMRFDFYDGRLSNQWNPRELIIEMNDRKLIDLKKLQQELNYIQFTLIKDFNKVVELCNGKKASSNSYIWVHRSGSCEGPPIILYQYTSSRSGEHAKIFLAGFTGYHVSDAYAGYEKVEGITRC